MYIARLLYPVKNLGPYERLGIWVSGCRRNCPGCTSPELRERAPEHKTTLDTLKKLIMILPEKPKAITISGGEPFDQAEELALLCEWLVNEISSDILVYSGYTLEQLKERNNSGTNRVLELIAALIDGEYMEELNKGNRIKGSENQKLHVFKKEYEADFRVLDTTTDGKRAAQAFMSSDGVVIAIGFEKPGFRNDFSETLRYTINSEENNGGTT